MSEIIKIKTEGKYISHDVKANKSVNVTFKMPYSEMTNYIQSIQMLNEDVIVAGKMGADHKPKKMGSFRIQNLNIDHDGEGKLKLNSMLDYIEPAALNELASRNDEPLLLFMKASIEDAEEEEE